MRKLPLLIIALLFYCQHSFANNAAAGELIYQWVSDSTYRFYFMLYTDCSANPEPDTVSLCFRNTCAGTGFSRTMTKFSSTPITPPMDCANKVKTQCDSPASTLPGYKTWMYSVSVTLPSRCTDWHIAATAYSRNSSINISNPSTTPFVSEIIFNNTGTNAVNSSPYFPVPAIAYIYNNAPVTYSVQAIDVDGDSLIYEPILPLTATGICGDTTSSVTLVTDVPALGVPGNPFQTGNTFVTNTSSGLLSFTPAEEGKNSIAVRIKEYRNGNLIGSSVRDIQFVVMSASYAPVAPIFDASVTGTLTGCVGDTIDFTFNVFSADTDAIYILSDNHAFSIPGSDVTYTHNASDSVHGEFIWIPTTVQAGLRSFILVVKDSTCRFPGIMTYYSYNIPIYIDGGVRARGDTTICPSGTAQLIATGSSSLIWSEMPGGATGSLSCTTCTAP